VLEGVYIDDLISTSSAVQPILQWTKYVNSEEGPMHTSVSRRHFVQLTALAAGVAISPAAGAVAQAAELLSSAPTADEVLASMLEGNKRFVRGELAHPRRTPAEFAPLAEGQNPVAVVVGCADSRVAPELVFDQGVGDLFVVRIAGNVVSGAGASVKGSIEYAVAELHVPLVMVLGHSQCGAVEAAIKHIHSNDAVPGSIGELISTIKPAVTQVKGKPGNLLENAIRANVDQGVERLKTLGPVLADAVKKGTVKIVGAIYDLRSGNVIVVS
jgi:carbonic anhydrase